MASVEYLAAFLDGEGYLALARIPRRHSHEYCVRVTISNSNRRILEELREAWGGILITVPPRKVTWKTEHVLIWTNAAAARLLARVSPHLRIKSEHAAALHDFLTHLRKCRRARDGLGRLLPLSLRELEIREGFYRRLRLLNVRGSLGALRHHARPARDSGSRKLSPEYLAGFVDAEGCLMVARLNGRDHGRPRYRARVSVGNTNRAVLEDLQRAYGGILVNQLSRKAGWKHAYQLVWAGRMVEQVLTVIMPHLRLKRKQAAVLRQFLRHKKRTRQGRRGSYFAPLPDEVVAFREGLYRRMRELNAKGPPRDGTQRHRRRTPHVRLRPRRQSLSAPENQARFLPARV